MAYTAKFRAQHGELLNTETSEVFDAPGKRIVQENQELYVMADKQAAWPAGGRR